MSQQTYELMKKANLLTRVQKEFLLDHWGSVVSLLREGKKKRPFKRVVTMPYADTKFDPDTDWYEPYVERRTTPQTDGESVIGKEDVLRTVQAGKLYDPETSEQMLQVLDLLEKYLSYEDNIAYDNICLFIHPLSNCSKKILLRPLKTVGITNRIENLSKKYRTDNPEMNKRTLNSIKKEFKHLLSLLRKRLGGDTQFTSNLEIETSPKEKTIKPNNDFVDRIFNLKDNFGWSKEQVLEFFSNAGSSFSPEEIENIGSAVSMAFEE